MSHKWTWRDDGAARAHPFGSARHAKRNDGRRPAPPTAVLLHAVARVVIQMLERHTTRSAWLLL
jgi:hypothetical protein